MEIILDLQNAINSQQVPEKKSIENWISSTLTKIDKQFVQPEITIRIVSPEESQALNLQYREKNKPTNVLSFPFEAPEMIPVEEIGELLGDLVICESILLQEAKQQNKSLESHWAHMVVHGVLHLLGFDHVDNKDAEKMEALEVKVLSDLGFKDPYQSV